MQPQPIEDTSTDQQHSLNSPTKVPASKDSITNVGTDFVDPSHLIEGVLFRARYLGTTQLVCEGRPTKSLRMVQAEEAVTRIKVNSKVY